MWVRGLKLLVLPVYYTIFASHPMWVRGLKLCPTYSRYYARVAPYVGAWIETFARVNLHTVARSHPMWVRGLKHVNSVNLPVASESHPMWVRGLKHFYYHKINNGERRTLCGCVD